MVDVDPRIAGDDGSTRSRRPAPVRPPYATIATVLIIGLIVTAGVTWLAATLEGRNQRHLLRLQAEQAAAVLTASVPSAESPLETAVAVADASGGSASTFQANIRPLVGPKRQYSEVSLWVQDASSVAMVSQVGAPVGGNGPVEASAQEALGHAGLTVSLTTHHSARVIRYGFGAGGLAPRYVVVAETVLPSPRHSELASNSAFSDLNFAIYLGRGQKSQDLLLSTFPELTPVGTTTYVSIPYGNTTLGLYAGPLGTLDGSFQSLLPWLIAAVGVVISFAGAWAAERLTRRRRTAEQDAQEIHGLYDELGALYGQQRSISETLQHALLPARTPQLPGVEIAVRYEAGAKGVDIGGDWYSVIAIDESRYAFVVGDVSGRGVSAATVMASLRFTIRAYAFEGHDPTTVLEHCSRHLRVLDDGHFATVLVGTGDLARGEIQLANAGHLSPVLIDSEGARLVETHLGVPLGLPGGHYPSVTLSLRPGSTFMAFTDGLIERRGESIDVGFDRLLGAVSQRVDKPLETLVTEVITELTGDVAEDDIAVLAMRFDQPTGSLA